jgi:hypothetical protein
MPQPPHADREPALSEIARCISEHGVKEGPKIARESFVHVHAATWCRWVKEMVGNPTRNSNRGELDGYEGPFSPPKHLPQVARPKFAQELDELRVDANMLRGFSTKDDGRTVKLPTFFLQQLKARIEIAKLAVQYAGLAADYEAQQAFYDSVVQEVAAESPDCARRIVTRLSALKR